MSDRIPYDVQASECWRAAAKADGHGLPLPSALALEAAGRTCAEARRREWLLEDAVRLLRRIEGPLADAGTLAVLREDAAALVARAERAGGARDSQ